MAVETDTTASTLRDHLLQHDNPEWNIIGALYTDDRYLLFDDLQETVGHDAETVRDALSSLEEQDIVQNAPYAQNSTNQQEETADDKYAFRQQRFGQTPERILDRLNQFFNDPDETALAIYDFLQEQDEQSAYTVDDRGVPETLLQRRFDVDDVRNTLHPLPSAAVVQQWYSTDDIPDDQTPYDTAVEEVDEIMQEELDGRYFQVDDTVYREIFDSYRDAAEL